MDDLLDLATEWDLTLGTVSDETRVVYARAVRQFAGWMAVAHPGTAVERVTRRHVGEALSSYV